MKWKSKWLSHLIGDQCCQLYKTIEFAAPAMYTAHFSIFTKDHQFKLKELT